MGFSTYGNAFLALSCGFTLSASAAVTTTTPLPTTSVTTTVNPESQLQNTTTARLTQAVLATSSSVPLSPVSQASSNVSFTTISPPQPTTTTQTTPTPAPTSTLPQGANCPSGWTPSLFENFNHRPAGFQYTKKTLKQDFTYLGLMSEEANSNTFPSVVASDRIGAGTALLQTYSQGCVGPNECAYQWHAGIEAVDEAWLSYFVRFDENFLFNRMGKVPGLCGGMCNTGGKIPDGTDGFSARNMWRGSKGNVVEYLYYVGMPTSYGFDVNYTTTSNVTGKTEKLSFKSGQWHNIRLRIKMNNPPTESNGEMEAWFDDIMAFNISNLKWRTADTLHIDQFYMSTFFGGNADADGSPQDQTAAFDDILVCKRANAPIFANPRVWSGESSLKCPRGSHAVNGTCTESGAGGARDNMNLASNFAVAIILLVLGNSGWE